ncbi:MAG: hypothetical protein ACRCZF_05755, partial [Gemmataceae bacterium]
FGSGMGGMGMGGMGMGGMTMQGQIYQQQFQQAAQGNGMGLTQYEPGRFFPVGLDAAQNPVSGTVLRPFSGVAFTNEGAFYRVPGTGSFTPFGTYVPGSGIYVNPFSGVNYNPQTGAIVRPR